MRSCGCSWRLAVFIVYEHGARCRGRASGGGSQVCGPVHRCIAPSGTLWRCRPCSTSTEGRSLPGLSRLEKGDKATAITHWTGPHTSFTRLTAKIDSVRLFRDTAIETGTLTANRKEHGQDSSWVGLSYTRVWVKDGKGWRLAHEQY